MKCPEHHKELKEISRFKDNQGKEKIMYKCPDCSYTLYKYETEDDN